MQARGDLANKTIDFTPSSRPTTMLRTHILSLAQVPLSYNQVKQRQQ